ncbi:MAG: ATPase inhibitor subunit zeta [Ruegeria sp.]|nr:ATPase inhibitor subunit zeta [Ruegeria sp.]
MTTFDERENAFEAKYAHDEEMQFKAQARCNKLLGLWAAEKLGKSGDEAAEYAKTVVIADFEEADEIFATGNFSKVMPVTKFEDRDLQPGPVAARARELSRLPRFSRPNCSRWRRSWSIRWNWAAGR